MLRTRRRVVIVGGGFGGLEAAKALDGVDVDVVLVDRWNYHLFQPLLYQVAMAGLSPAEIASPIRAILSDQANIRVVLGEVTNIDLEKRVLRLADPEGKAATLETFDWLILAVGASSSYFGHDEWEPYAPGLKSVEDALEIRRRVLLAFEEAERITNAQERRALLTFVVIGGGPTGVELSGAIAELATHVVSKDFRSIDPTQAKVVLVEAGTRILPSFPADLASSAIEQLAELGVDVKTGARVVAIDDHGVDLERQNSDEVPGLGSGSERERIATRTVLWGAGVRANPLARTLGVPIDRQGRLIVGQDCSLPDHPNVFAIGDVAHFEEDGRLLPGVSPVAMQQGRYVARIIAAETADQERSTSDGEGTHPSRTSFRYFDKGSMATIGRSRAIAYARGIKMHGFIAWLAWLFIHVFYLIGFRNRIAVLLNWFWSYVSYQRGARLITTTGWRPTASVPSPSLPAPEPASHPLPPRSSPAPAPSSRPDPALVKVRI